MDAPRIPPKKIRVTGLQEAQLSALATIDEACARMFLDIGIEAPRTMPRSEGEIARLARTHDVMVAEADHEPAGYLVWADEEPGVAWLPILIVAPSYQRFGIATRLLRELGEKAGSLGIDTVVTPVWSRAPWALAF